MCTGSSLQTPHPTPVALAECKSPDTVNVSLNIGQYFHCEIHYD